MKERAHAQPGHTAATRPQPFFARAGAHSFFPGSRVQAKLTIGAPGDRFEREADQVADQVLAQGSAPPVQRMCTECAKETEEVRRQPMAGKEEEEEGVAAPGVVQAKPEPGDGDGDGDGGNGDRIAARLQASQGGGQALPSPLRQEMSAAFGSDFSGVRVHTDGTAAQLSRDLGAQAFTHGRDVFFGQGKFAPESARGRHLLAHELTHVLQQGGGPLGPPSMVQRAETDDRSCAGLTDIESAVDTKVNAEIAAARLAAGTPLVVADLLDEVHSRLGNGAISPIETFIEGLSTAQRRIPPTDLSGTKYSGAGSAKLIYLAQSRAHVVGSSALVHGICIGADKLGHFFGEGNLYFRITQAGGTSADARSVGRFAEITIQGLSTTGVFSNADLAANLAGLQFYKDLEADPSGFTFKVKDYITTRWNEQTNPSFYDAGIAEVVWQNLLTGRWQGPVNVPTPVQTGIDLTATVSNVTGDYEYPVAKPTGKGKITNGKIRFLTTSVTGTFRTTETATPVNGIVIEFDWERGKGKGKGKWESAGEQTLNGTWGKGSSRTGGGDWNLKKV